MNKKQLWVLWIGIAIIAVMLLFPPQIIWTDQYTFWEVGRHFIFNPMPGPPTTVNYGKLIPPIIAVALITLGLFFSLKDRGKK